MQATKLDIELLERLQKIDLEISRLEKQLEELPQRKTILEARSKIASLETKQAQILSLMKDVKKNSPVSTMRMPRSQRKKKAFRPPSKPPVVIFAALRPERRSLMESSREGQRSQKI